MIENSLLHAYKKENEIGAKLAEVVKKVREAKKNAPDGSYRSFELESQISTANGFDDLLMDMFKRPKIAD